MREGTFIKYYGHEMWKKNNHSVYTMVAKKVAGDEIPGDV